MSRFRFLAALSLAASGEPAGDTLTDVAFSTFTEWSQACLSRSKMDALEGYSSLMERLPEQVAATFKELSPDQQEDAAFMLRVRYRPDMMEFISPKLISVSEQFPGQEEEYIDILERYVDLLRPGTTSDIKPV